MVVEPVGVIVIGADAAGLIAMVVEAVGANARRGGLLGRRRRSRDSIFSSQRRRDNSTNRGSERRRTRINSVSSGRSETRGSTVLEWRKKTNNVCRSTA